MNDDATIPPLPLAGEGWGEGNRSDASPERSTPTSLTRPAAGLSRPRERRVLACVTMMR